MFSQQKKLKQQLLFLSSLLVLFLLIVQCINTNSSILTVAAFTIQYSTILSNKKRNIYSPVFFNKQQKQKQQQQRLLVVKGRCMMFLRYSNNNNNINDDNDSNQDENIIGYSNSNSINSNYNNFNNRMTIIDENDVTTNCNNNIHVENNNDNNNNIIQQQLYSCNTNRRNVLQTLIVPAAAAAAATGYVSSSFIGSSSHQSYAATTVPTTIDNTDSSKLIKPTSTTSSSTTIQKVISPYVTISTQQYDKNNNLRTIQRKLPRVGYSTYKTTIDNIENGIITALYAGVRHFDIGTDYNTNTIVGTILQEYINTGLGIIDTFPTTTNSNDIDARRRRRNEIYITHKLSNNEQSTDSVAIQNSIRTTHEQLFGSIDYPITTSTTSKRNNNKKQKNYIDAVLLHSPLTDQDRRLTTYKTLINMQRQYNNPIIGLVGVCHYSVDALNEIITNNLPPPSIIQLVLSPFNQHCDIQQWIKQYSTSDRTILSCSAWSKLSSTAGPIVGWTTLSDIAKRTNRTNAQVLISWAIQNNFIVVPRSNANYKIEKQNMYENTFVQSIQNKPPLSTNDMMLLNSLNEQYPVCRLGIMDGWTEQQILNTNTWDPTTAPLII